MLRTFTLLARGAIADNAQSFRDANAIAILRQQIRDAASALAAARRELAVVIAFQAAERRALDGLTSRIATLTDSARKALADGRDDLGTQAATLLARLEDERTDREAATTRFATEIARLKALVGAGQDRLRDLDRGLRSASAMEALRRAGASSRHATALSAGALGDAEETLSRLEACHQAEADGREGLASLDADADVGIEAHLEAAGYGRERADPKAILARLKASL